MHVPPDGGEPVHLVGDTYTTLLRATQTNGESPRGRGKVGPPLNEVDMKAMAAVADKYGFTFD
ncbi:hypothetical protein [Streptomyces sp. NPDC050704]|uniref:hypothetical protein n=1 Tax=Streptomyces sp. NPDC050704 TaxID=3157219 RepID=UPI003437FD1D